MDVDRKVDIKYLLTTYREEGIPSSFPASMPQGALQAANIIGSCEIVWISFMDEDTSATNFMIRDARMQALQSRKEPNSFHRPNKISL